MRVGGGRFRWGGGWEGRAEKGEGEGELRLRVFEKAIR